MGKNAGNKLKRVLKVRFNLNGLPPPQECRKVGILDEYHLWCSLVDPYFRDLNLEISGEMKQVKKMIKFFLRGGSNSDVELRRDILREYQFLKQEQGLIKVSLTTMRVRISKRILVGCRIRLKQSR